MKKLLLVLPLIAGASWAGTTYYAGAQTQPTYEKLLAQLNDFKPLTVISKEYNQGFMTSTAITQVRDSARADANVLLTLQHVIDHSPIGVDSEGARIGASTVVTTLMTDDANSEMLEYLSGFEDTQPFRLNTRIGLSGNTVNELTVAPYNQSSSDVNVSFEGGTLVIDSGTEGKITASGNLGELSAYIPDTLDINVSASTIAAKLNRIGSGIYSGNYRVNIPLINLENSNTGSIATLTDTSLSSQSNIEGDIMSSDAVFSISSVDAPAPITSAEYKVKIGGLSLSALQHYQKQVANLPLLDSPTMVDREQLEMLLDAYKTMITPGINLAIELHLGNTGGVMGASLNANFKGDQSATGYDNIATLRDLLMATDIRTNLDADAEAVHQTPAAMLMMHPMSAEYIINDGVKYTSDIHLHDLLMEVNGDPRSLESMLGPMIDTPLEIPVN